MTDFYNRKLVYAGYQAGGNPPTPVAQDWPLVLFYDDAPRNEMQGFFDATTVTSANQGSAGPSDRTTQFQNQQTLGTVMPVLDDYDFVYRLKPYFTHHRIYNPNNHPMWVKVDVIVPRMPLTAAADPAAIITNYLTTQYQSTAVVQHNSTTGVLATGNVDWKTLNTTVGVSSGASIFGLFPIDRSWSATYKWKTISTRKKVLIPAGGIYKFRVYHKGMGPMRSQEFAQPSFIPYPYTDRIIKVSAMSTIGMTPSATDSSADRLHTDFPLLGIWRHSVKTMKCHVLNKPIMIQSMTTEQASTAVLAPSVNPQITVSQQVMGPSPP
jgi:hypothetical protein